MISSFFKSRKAKQFTFSARYYDADKEAFEQKYKQIEKEMEQDTAEKYSSGYRPDFKSQWKDRNRRVKYNTGSGLRLLIILCVLVGICYYLLYT